MDSGSFKEAVEEVKARADIVSVVGTTVRLTRAGRTYKGLCPFHREKSPSFHVNPDRGFFHCFGCGASGDVIGFVQRRDNTAFIDALKALAEAYGVTLPEKSARNAVQGDELARLHAALVFAQRFFAEQLERSPQVREARDYLASRAISAESVAAFGLGYAPASWDALLIALRREGFGEAAAVDAGLAARKESDATRVYDRFRHRITFPVMHQSGRPLGFSARALDKSEPAKYINTPETRVYQKSRLLYGLHRARPHIRPERGAVLVEGNVDVIRLHQAGIENTVAACGTAVTSDHIGLIARMTDRLTVIFDGDTAGRAAAEKVLEPALRAGMWPKGVWLPDGVDPDDFVRAHGGDPLNDLIARADDLFTGLLKRQAADGDAGLSGQERRLRWAVEKLGLVASRIERELGARRAAEVLGLDVGFVNRALREHVYRAEQRGAPAPAPRAAAAAVPEAPLPPAEIEVAALLLTHSGLIAAADWAAYLPLFTRDDTRELVRRIAERDHTDEHALLSESAFAAIREAVYRQFTDPPYPDAADAESVLPRVLDRLEHDYLLSAARRLAAERDRAEARGDMTRAYELMRERTTVLQNIQQIRRSLDSTPSTDGPLH